MARDFSKFNRPGKSLNGLSFADERRKQKGKTLKDDMIGKRPRKALLARDAQREGRNRA